MKGAVMPTCELDTYITSLCHKIISLQGQFLNYLIFSNIRTDSACMCISYWLYTCVLLCLYVYWIWMYNWLITYANCVLKPELEVYLSLSVSVKGIRNYYVWFILLYRRRERHAKTIDIAQEEVLTCLGIHLYERLHRIWQKLRAEEQTWQMLFYLGVDALRKSFEVKTVGCFSV